MPQNLISDKYYDLWLSIDTKNSPLSGILLLLQVAELRRSKIKIFKQKKVKISNFELQKRYIPQKKAKNIHNSDSARKSVNFCKKKLFFSIFPIFATCLRTPWNFWHSFFENFKKYSKNGFTGSYQTLKGTKSRILVNLGQILWKWQTIFDRAGHNGPPPRLV